MLSVERSAGWSRTQTVFLAALCCTLVGTAVYVAFFRTSGSYKAFTIQYQQTYAELATYEQILFLPGSGSNETRQKLNNVLNSVLGDTHLSDSDRLALSKQGLVLLSALDRQIREVDLSQKSFERSVKNLSSSVSSVTSNKKGAENIVLLFKTYNDRSEQIIDDLDSMHKHMENIFLRIEKDNGALTQEHITELNDLVPETEKTFDALFALYKDLEKTKKKINAAVEEFSSSID